MPSLDRGGRGHPLARGQDLGGEIKYMRIQEKIRYSMRDWKRVEKEVGFRVRRELREWKKPMPHWLILERMESLNRRRFPSEERFIELIGELHGRLRVRRNYPLCNRFFGDFTSLDRRLVFEIDGETHAETVDYDLMRDRFLGEYGFRVVRLRIGEEMAWPDAVAAAVAEKVLPLTKRQRRKYFGPRREYSKAFLRSQIKELMQ